MKYAATIWNQGEIPSKESLLLELEKKVQAGNR